MTENIKVAVVGPKLDEFMFRAVPLIQNFLHEILVIVQLKPKWSLVSFATGVTLNVQPHTNNWAGLEWGQCILLMDAAKIHLAESCKGRNTHSAIAPFGDM